VTNLLERIESGKSKTKKKFKIQIPILIKREKTSTRIEPAKTVYQAVAPASKQSGIIDAAIWVGYAWADEPRNHAVVMVTGDEKEIVSKTAERLAKGFWDARFGFQFVAPTKSWNECLEAALKSNKHPFFISDMGDNPTAGGAGDVSWTLKEILSRPEFKSSNGPSLIYASIPGPDLVQKAIAVGVGKEVDGMAGAEVDSRFAGPVRISGIVESIVSGDVDAS
jgi:microcystin degradation protein MlrC